MIVVANGRKKWEQYVTFEPTISSTLYSTSWPFNVKKRKIIRIFFSSQESKFLTNKIKIKLHAIKLVILIGFFISYVLYVIT